MLPYVVTIAVLVAFAVRERRRASGARTAVDEVAEVAPPGVA